MKEEAKITAAVFLPVIMVAVWMVVAAHWHDRKFHRDPPDAKYTVDCIDHDSGLAWCAPMFTFAPSTSIAIKENELICTVYWSDGGVSEDRGSDLCRALHEVYPYLRYR